MKLLLAFLFIGLLTAVESHAQMACQGLPASAHWATRLADISPSQSVDSGKMKAFFRSYLALKGEYLQRNRSVLSRAEACFSGTTSGVECEQFSEFQGTALNDLVRLARLNLALAYDVRGSQVISRHLETLNLNLLNGDRYRVQAWSPLTASEREQAERVWSEVTTRLRDRIAQSTEVYREQRGLSEPMMESLRRMLYWRALKKVKETFQGNYESLTSAFLPLNAITQPDLSIVQIRELFRTFNQHLANRLEGVGADLAFVNSQTGSYFGHGVTMRAFENPGLIELTLAREPAHCEAGMGLASYAQMVELRFMIASFSTMLASPFIRPMAALAIGVPLSLSSFHSNYFAYRRSLDDSLIGLYGRDGYAFLGDFDQRQNLYTTEAWMMPLVILPIAGTRAFANLARTASSMRRLQSFYAR